ncbi:MAG: malto-oligosyltrehalose trehalohydrolase [Chthoniobacterales bacterium]
MAKTTARRLPIGAEVSAPEQTDFRVWAPKAERIEVALEASVEPDAERTFHPLTAEGNGYFSGTVAAGAGAFYRFRIAGNEHLHPDPASRAQPGGPHRSSQVIDPRTFRWSDDDWRGLKLRGQIIYELHVGTFTPAGTWAAAAKKLPELKETGISVIEMMPIAEFAGEFGWGYDGVDLFAPCRLYGKPDDLRRFIDAAHSSGIGVILDVVYNHFGPEGNYLRVFSDDYFSDRYQTEWGEALNFDGPHSEPVREFFLSNVRYWIEEFHFDGFRFDATQSIFDRSEKHILAELSEAARAAAGKRKILLLAENEPQEPRIVRSRDAGGYGLDALWNDDLHHTALVALTGRTHAYYTDYRGAPQEFVSAVKHGYLYQGQHYRWQQKRRGHSARGVGPAAFVGFLENHDQVANSGTGERVRLTTSPGRYRALTALLLLAPWTPMLFQGQEFGATTPFLYFADLDGELRGKIRAGRRHFLEQFPELATPAAQTQLADPGAQDTFERSKLDWSEREKFPQLSALHHSLIELRRDDPIFSRQERGQVDGAVLGERCFVLRYFDSLGENDRLLVVNLGPALALEVVPEPLLAPVSDAQAWETLWSSEAPEYGGPGTVPLETETGWFIPAEAAVALQPGARLLETKE